MERFVLGLTGGIASGKSCVSRLYERLGAKVVDADIVSREVMRDPSVVMEIERAFPGVIENGKLNRRFLRERAFESEQNTAKLNAITHPAIKNECLRRVNDLAGWVVFVAPLMYETGLNKICDAVLTIACDTDLRIKRLIERDNTNVDSAEKILLSQMTDAERGKLADYIIENNGSINELETKAEQLVRKLGLVGQ